MSYQAQAIVFSLLFQMQFLGNRSPHDAIYKPAINSHHFVRPFYLSICANKLLKKYDSHLL